MANLYSIIRKPIITKKASTLLKNNKILFEVYKHANKYQIKEACKLIFKTKKVKVHTILIRGKKKRMGKFLGKKRNIKKAIISVSKSININQLISKE